MCVQHSRFRSSRTRSKPYGENRQQNLVTVGSLCHPADSTGPPASMCPWILGQHLGWWLPLHTGAGAEGSRARSGRRSLTGHVAFMGDRAAPGLQYTDV